MQEVWPRGMSGVPEGWRFEGDENNEGTGIESLSDAVSTPQSYPLYDLQGRRVEGHKKGVVLSEILAECAAVLPF